MFKLEPERLDEYRRRYGRWHLFFIICEEFEQFVFSKIELIITLKP